jgi:hypothetical protein
LSLHAVPCNSAILLKRNTSTGQHSRKYVTRHTSHVTRHTSHVTFFAGKMILSTCT